MKKIRILIIALSVVLLFSACTQSGVSLQEYEALKKLNEQLLLDIKEYEEGLIVSNLETVDVKISGGFVATVLGATSAYPDSEYPPEYIILAQFQANPFTMYMGNELISQLEVGEAYYFEIMQKEIYNVPKYEYDNGFMTLQELVANNHIFVASFREPNEDEYGLLSPSVSYEILSAEDLEEEKEITQEEKEVIDLEKQELINEILMTSVVKLGEVEMYLNEENINSLTSQLENMTIKKNEEEIGSHFYPLFRLESEEKAVSYGVDALGNTLLVVSDASSTLKTYDITGKDAETLYKEILDIINSGFTNSNTNIYEVIEKYIYYYENEEFKTLTKEEKDLLLANLELETMQVATDFNYDNYLLDFTLYTISPSYDLVPMNFITIGENYYLEISFSNSNIDSFIFKISNNPYNEKSLKEE